MSLRGPGTVELRTGGSVNLDNCQLLYGKAGGLRAGTPKFMSILFPPAHPRRGLYATQDSRYVVYQRIGGAMVVGPLRHAYFADEKDSYGACGWLMSEGVDRVARRFFPTEYAELKSGFIR